MQKNIARTSSWLVIYCIWKEFLSTNSYSTSRFDNFVRENLRSCIMTTAEECMTQSSRQSSRSSSSTKKDGLLRSGLERVTTFLEHLAHGGWLPLSAKGSYKKWSAPDIRFKASKAKWVGFKHKAHTYIFFTFDIKAQKNFHSQGAVAVLEFRKEPVYLILSWMNGNVNIVKTAFRVDALLDITQCSIYERKSNLGRLSERRLFALPSYPDEKKRSVRSESQHSTIRLHYEQRREKFIADPIIRTHRQPPDLCF